jgi:ribosomal protein L37AE/L43A
MSEYSRRALEYRIAARVIAESCESCERREFDHIVEDAFVCESCTWQG